MIHKRPAVLRGLVKLNTLCFIGYGFTDHSDFIISRDRDRVMRAFFGCIFENSHLWDEVLLTQIPDSSPNFELVKSEIQKGGYEVTTDVLIKCPYIEIEGDFEAYYNRLGKNLKHDVAKKSRRLTEQGLEPDFEVATRIDEKILEELRGLNRKRAEATGHRSFFLRKDRYNFVSELARVFNENQSWLLFLFRAKGNLIAYRLCFAYNNVVYDWNTSYDLDYSQYSLGKILLRPVLAYCFEKRYGVFDFMAGDEDYKLKWTEKVRTHYRIGVRRKNLKTRVVRLYSGLKSRVLQK
ncbi:MAG: GNAT family N-acetyltransferase [Candidatus Eisenbacteria bacterium]|nr:GNAT family N-acetyltransferase [Candidatus Eisenbacteria bacterium]